MFFGIGLFVIVVFLAGLLGFVLLDRGLLVYRVGETPYCAACDYNLTGRASERCSECGALLEQPEAIVHGELRRRTRTAVIGGLLLAFVMSSLLAPFLVMDWYNYMPTAWVISDLKSADTMRAARAWTELQSRMARKPLSARQHNRLVNMGLDMQAATSAGGSMPYPVTYLAQCYLNDKLTDRQAARFLEQGLKLDLKIRPRVVLGDPISGQLHFELKWGIPLRMILSSDEFTIDGEPMKSPFEGAYQTPHGTGSVGLTPYPHGGLVGIPHTLQSTSSVQKRIFNRIRVRLFPYPSPTTQASGTYDYTPERLKAWGNPFYDDTVDFERFVDILPEEPAEYIKLVNDDALAADFRDNVTLEYITFRRGEYRDRRTQERRTGWEAGGPYLLSDSSPPMPVNVTADVYVHVAGNEYRIGTAMAKRVDKWIHFDIEGLDGDVEPFETFDLVLRPNPQLARATLDIYEIYNGVIVNEGIKAEFEESDSGR